MTNRIYQPLLLKIKIKVCCKYHATDLKIYQLIKPLFMEFVLRKEFNIVDALIIFF